MRHISTIILLLAIMPVPFTHEARALPGSPPMPVSLPNIDESEAHLLFVGDLMMGRYVGAQLAPGRYDAPFKAITPYVSPADLAIGNLEGPIVPTGAIAIPRPYPNLLNLTGDARAAPALARSGFDLLSMANNHAFDSGPKGITWTADALREVGIAPLGLDAGRGQQAVVREVHGLKIAFLAYTDIINIPGTSGIAYINPGLQAHRERMASEIRSARKNADVVVVMMHWGTEYAVMPDKGQRELAQLAADAGADLVVGAHPHVAQGMEALSSASGGHSTLVAYSLGNALFDQQSRLELRQGLSLQCTLDRDGVKSARLVPLEITSGSAGYTMNVQDNAAGQPALQRAAQSTPAGLQWRALWDAAQPAQGLALAYRRPASLGNAYSMADLGISAPTRVQLDDGKLSVQAYMSATWQTVWQTDPEWRVTGFTVGDANADGKPDLVYTLWKRRLVWERPPGGGMRVNQQGGDVLPHIYINSWKDGEMRPLWHGSPQPAPALAVGVAPIGKNGKPLLAVLESSDAQTERGPGHIRLWEWTGGFGYELAATLPGLYSEMWSDGRQLVFRYKCSGTILAVILIFPL